MARAFLLIILISGHLGARAEARPKWTAATPRADGVYKYYVGRALSEVNEQGAWRLAKDQAQEAAVRENFGVETSIAASSFESAKEVSLDRRVQELFPKVRLVDFEQVDSFVEERKGRFSVWIKFRYPLQQIEAERRRLLAVEAPAAQDFNEVGRPQMAYSTAMEVTSDPPGIPVFIDSERWGVTPLRLVGVLPVGVRSLRLSHAHYQDVLDEAVLLKGAVKKIHHRLRLASGFVSVSSAPSGAEVYVEGIRRGKTPLSGIELVAGSAKRIEVRQQGYETQIQMVEVQKGEEREVNFVLHSLKRKLASVQEDLGTGHQRAWLFGLSLGVSGPAEPKPYGLATLQFGLVLEKRFLYFLGLRAGASYHVALDETDESQQSEHSAIEGSGYFVGLPIYLSPRDRGFYLMPEVGAISHKRLLVTSTEDQSREEEFIKLRAVRRGGRVGYMNMDAHIDLWVGAYEYDWREWGKVRTGLVGMTFTWNDGGGS